MRESRWTKSSIALCVCSIGDARSHGPTSFFSFPIDYPMNILQGAGIGNAQLPHLIEDAGGHLENCPLWEMLVDKRLYLWSAMLRLRSLWQ